MTRFVNIVFFLFLSIFTFSEIEKAWASEPLEELEIVVIGGGLSGLTAARELKGNDLPYVLFEAREMLGGRTYSETQGDSVFNMGGEWIDAEHEAMQELAKALGVPLQKETYAKPVRSTYDGTELSPADMIAILRSIISKLNTVVPTDTGQHKSLQDLLSELSLEENEELFIKAYITSDLGLSPEGVQSGIAVQFKENLEDFLNIVWYQSSCLPLWPLGYFAYQYRVVGGMTTMIEAMQSLLDEERLRLNHQLTKITKDKAGKFHLSFQTDNAEFHEVIANAVIMTIPFSVLRHIELDDSLGLSPLHKEAIATLSYGTNAKIQMPDAMPLPFRYHLNTARREGDVTIPSATLWNPVSGPGTTIFIGGKAGENLDQDNAKVWAQFILGRAKSGAEPYAFDNSAPPLIKNWYKDPFARGSYSTPGLHSCLLDAPSKTLPGFRACADPVGSFCIAGEHTQMKEGYMESAVQSGIEVAKYLYKNYYRKSEVH